MTPVTYEIIAYRVASYRFWRITPDGPVDCLSRWDTDPGEGMPQLPDRPIPIPSRSADKDKLACQVDLLRQALPAFLPGDTRGADMLAAIASGDRQAIENLSTRCHWGREGIEQIEGWLDALMVVWREDEKLSAMARSMAVVRAAMQTAVDAAQAALMHDYASGSSRLEIAMEREPGTTLAEHGRRAEEAVLHFRSDPRNLRPH